MIRLKHCRFPSRGSSISALARTPPTSPLKEMKFQLSDRGRLLVPVPVLERMISDAQSNQDPGLKIGNRP